MHHEHSVLGVWHAFPVTAQARRSQHDVSPQTQAPTCNLRCRQPHTPVTSRPVVDQQHWTVSLTAIRSTHTSAQPRFSHQEAGTNQKAGKHPDPWFNLVPSHHLTKPQQRCAPSTSVPLRPPKPAGQHLLTICQVNSQHTSSAHHMHCTTVQLLYSCPVVQCTPTDFLHTCSR